MCWVGEPDPFTGMGILGVTTRACSDLPAVNILNLFS